MVNYRVSGKEFPYFCLMMVFGLMGYCAIGWILWSMHVTEETLPIAMIYDFYILLILVFMGVGPVFLKGALIGNGIKITNDQFPQYAEVIQRMSQDLGLKRVPQSYIIQSGGIMNAFATRLFGRDYVVIYSAVLSKAENEGQDAVEFIIGHELGHIKRNHTSFIYNVLTLPAHLVPFLFKAYSRAREYTCDSIGHSLAPKGSEKGLVILSAGKELSSLVNVDSMLAAYNSDKGFCSWFTEIFSTHPLISKRIQALRKI